MQNCWEYKSCGREPGGAMVNKKGVCPTATYKAADGFLGGTNGGRACAFIAGAFCCETLPGTVPDKSKNCAACSFYDNLRYIYGRDFSVSAFLAHIGSEGKSKSAQVLNDYPFSAIKRQAANF